MVLALSALLAANAGAQSYDLSWHTVDGGGATFSTGGSYSVGATIGQPDAGGPLGSGGFTVVGGFWAGTVNPQADLSISKTDGQATAVPGQSITYTILARNLTGAPASGATVSDTVPASLTGVSWTCVGSLGGTCAASGNGNISDTVGLPPGAGVAYTLTATVSPAATGSLSNTATITAPGGITDPNGANNTATDTDALTPPADLSVTKTDGVTTIGPGQPMTYTITVANGGPSAVAGATVTDALPASLFGATWSCSGAGGGTCTASGSGNIADAVNLPAGGSVTYMLTATLSLDASGAVANTATTAVPAGFVDLVSGNNSATDTDTVNGCGFTDVSLVPDGRAIPDAVAAGGTRWYAASVALGRSYSVEVENTAGTSTSPGTLTIFSGDDGCSGSNTQVVSNTSTVDPGGNAATVRVSFTAAGSQNAFQARLVSASGSALPLSVRWAETTLYSAAWSDNGTYDTFYFIQNTTAVTVQATLTLVDTTGAEVTTAALIIPAGRDVTVNTLALDTPRNKTGIARLAHDGPPGALVGTVAVVNLTSTPAYVQAVKLRTLRESR